MLVLRSNSESVQDHTTAIIYQWRLMTVIRGTLRIFTQVFGNSTTCCWPFPPCLVSDVRKICIITISDTIQYCHEMERALTP